MRLSGATVPPWIGRSRREFGRRDLLHRDIPGQVVGRRSSVGSSASSTGISATNRPPNMTIARSQASWISLSSEVKSTAPDAAAAHEFVDLLLGADVDPARRVEAQHRPDPPATQRAIVTFCWLPPDSWRTSDARAYRSELATARRRDPALRHRDRSPERNPAR
jgi:hypothetical protein